MPENNPTSDESEISERKIDEILQESFPASDPPSWTLGSIGGKNFSKLSLPEVLDEANSIEFLSPCGRCG